MGDIDVHDIYEQASDGQGAKFLRGLAWGVAIMSAIELVLQIRRSREEAYYERYAPALENAGSETEVLQVRLRYRHDVSRFRACWYTFWALGWGALAVCLMDILLVHADADMSDTLGRVIAGLFWAPPLIGSLYCAVRAIAYVRYLADQPRVS